MPKRVAPLISPVRNLGIHPTGDTMEYEEKFKIIDKILKDRYSLFTDIDYYKFIDALIIANNVTDYLGVSSYRFRKMTKAVFPDKPEKGKLINFILAMSDYKVCRKCDTYLTLNFFRANSRNYDGLNSHCKKCQSIDTAKTQPARQAKYNAAKLQRTPPWANLDKIKEIYDNCPEGYHVDHIVPLQGGLVSGLHVETNLQYLPAIENIKKGNKFNLTTRTLYLAPRVTGSGVCLEC